MVSERENKEEYFISEDGIEHFLGIMQEEVIPGRFNRMRFGAKLIGSLMANHLKEVFIEYPKAAIKNTDTATMTIDMRQWEQDRQTRLASVTERVGNWAVEKHIFSPQASVNWVNSQQKAKEPNQH